MSQQSFARVHFRFVAPLARNRRHPSRAACTPQTPLAPGASLPQLPLTGAPAINCAHYHVQAGAAAEAKSTVALRPPPPQPPLVAASPRWLSTAPPSGRCRSRACCPSLRLWTTFGSCAPPSQLSARPGGTCASPTVSCSSAARAACPSFQRPCLQPLLAPRCCSRPALLARAHRLLRGGDPGWVPFSRGSITDGHAHCCTGRHCNPPGCSPCCCSPFLPLPAPALYPEHSDQPFLDLSAVGGWLARRLLRGPAAERPPLRLEVRHSDGFQWPALGDLAIAHQWTPAGLAALLASLGSSLCSLRLVVCDDLLVRAALLLCAAGEACRWAEHKQAGGRMILNNCTRPWEATECAALSLAAAVPAPAVGPRGVAGSPLPPNGPHRAAAGRCGRPSQRPAGQRWLTLPQVRSPAASDAAPCILRFCAPAATRLRGHSCPPGAAGGPWPLPRYPQWSWQPGACASLLPCNPAGSCRALPSAALTRVAGWMRFRRLCARFRS